MPNLRIPASPTAISAISTDVVIKLAMKGTAASGLAVIATGALTLSSGAVGAETSTTAKDGGVVGVYAVATYATLGALVDAINTGSNWVASMWGGVRADFTATNHLTDFASTQVKNTTLDISPTTSVVAQTTLYAMGVRVSRANLRGNLDAGYRYGISGMSGVYTTLTAPVVKVLGTKPGSNVERLVFSAVGPAAGTAFEFNHIDWGNELLWGDVGEALTVRVEGATGYTAPRINVNAIMEQIGTGVQASYVKSDI
jgi:hypothetical protein